MMPLLARLGRWLVANPLWGLIAGLLAALGAAKLRQRHLERRTAEAQRTADRMRVKLMTVATKEQETALERDLEAASGQAEAARIEEAEAAKDAAGPLEERRDIAKRWPTR